MSSVIHPFQLLAISLAGWLNRHQQAVIDYLIEENRVLKDPFDGQKAEGSDLPLHINHTSHMCNGRPDPVWTPIRLFSAYLEFASSMSSPGFIMEPRIYSGGA